MVAFAAIAGLPPHYGLYTAMVTPIIAALFGSSRHLISGPTTAISIVIFASVSHHATPGTPEFITLALTMTFLAGVYQLAFGLARLGVLVNFVSHTVVMGFTAGAAILIATSQLKHVLGIPLPRGESFAHTWVEIYHQLGQTNLTVLVIALVTLLTALICKRLLPRLPNLLLGLIAGSLAAMVAGFFIGLFTTVVPVLRIDSPDGKLRAVVFGYACHATTLSFYQWSGDYAGFAPDLGAFERGGAAIRFGRRASADFQPAPWE